MLHQFQLIQQEEKVVVMEEDYDKFVVIIN